MCKHNSPSQNESLIHFAKGSIRSNLSAKATQRFAFRLCVTEEQLNQKVAAQKKGSKSHG